MEGITEALFTESDKRPVVSGLELTVDNESGFVVASTSKPGFIYLVKYGSDPFSKADLDSLLGINLGRMGDAPQPDVSIPLYTNGLPGGFYNYYAVDEDLRVSAPGIKWVTVEATGPVLGLDKEQGFNPFTAYQLYEQIVVDPGSDEGYSLEIFNISGMLLYRESSLQGIQQIGLQGTEGIILIRKRSSSNVSTLKVSLL